MIKDADKIQLKQRIGHLPKEKQVALALLFCKRMVPALNKFAKDGGFDCSVYRERLDDAWRSLDQGTSSSNYGEAAKQCLDHAPDTENFIHPLMLAVLNAALSVWRRWNFSRIMMLIVLLKLPSWRALRRHHMRSPWRLLHQTA
jgi:hypothetical protein